MITEKGILLFPFFSSMSCVVRYTNSQILRCTSAFIRSQEKEACAVLCCAEEEMSDALHSCCL